MPSEEYQIVPYQPAYHESVLALLAHLWGSDQQRNAAYMDWKYNANPYNHPPVIFLALQDGHLAGVRSFFPMHWQLGKNSTAIACLQDVDTVIHPDHRRRGLLTKMSLAVMDSLKQAGYHFTITLSSNPKSSAANLKYGWQVVAPLYDLQWQAGAASNLSGRWKHLLRRANRWSRRRLSGGPNLPINPFEYLDRHFARTASKPGKIRLVRELDPESMVELAARRTLTKHFRHIRDRAFYEWRFANPRSEYRFLVAGNEEISGYLVLQAPRSGGGWQVNLVDWEAESPEIFSELIAVALEAGQFSQLSTWSTGIPADHRQILVAAGFRSPEQSKPDQENAFQQVFLLRPLSTTISEEDWVLEGANMRDIANWDLRPIYSDIY